jgi:hypothetical protein
MGAAACPVANLSPGLIVRTVTISRDMFCNRYRGLSVVPAKRSYETYGYIEHYQATALAIET